MASNSKCIILDFFGLVYGKPVHDQCKPYEMFGVSEMETIGRFMGNAELFSISIEVERSVVQKTHCIAQYCASSSIRASNLRLELSDASRENLAHAYWGTNKAIDKGENVDCVLVSGSLKCGLPVKFPNKGVDPATVQIWQDNGGVKGDQLVQGVHFKADVYCLEALVTIGPCYWISYEYGCYDGNCLEMMTAQPPKMNLTFKGKNKGNCDNKLYFFEMYNVDLSPESTFNIIGGERNRIVFNGDVLGRTNALGECESIKMYDMVAP